MLSLESWMPRIFEWYRARIMVMNRHKKMLVIMGLDDVLKI